MSAQRSASESAASWRTASAEETERLGAALAPALAAGDLIVLSGPLGSGKTRFVAGLARGLGVRGPVKSPSFTLIHEHRGAPPLVHVDLYRLDPLEAERLGLEEHLERAVVAVEWGERLPMRLSREALWLSFVIVSEREREIGSRSEGSRAAALLAAWHRHAPPPGGFRSGA